MHEKNKEKLFLYKVETGFKKTLIFVAFFRLFMSENWIYNIIPELRLTIVLFNNIITLKDLISFVVSASSNNSFNKEFNLIFDFRRAELKISDKEVKEWIKFVGENPAYYGERKTAFVTARPIDVVIGILYNEWKGDIPISINVFSTLSAAVKWINLSLDNYPRIIDEIVALELKIKVASHKG